MLQAGRYYVGDLSVVLTPEEVLHLQQFKDGYCSLPDGTTIWKMAVENGIYRTTYGNQLSVSVGVLGVTPFKHEYTNNVYTININKYGMVFSSLDKPVNVHVDRGDVNINEMIIDTNNDHYFSGEITPQS
jgi:hypothetical protein